MTDTEPPSEPSAEDEINDLLALSEAIRTLSERGWTVTPPAGTWRTNAPRTTP